MLDKWKLSVGFILLFTILLIISGRISIHSKDVYLFYYFSEGEKQEAGLHVAYSYDLQKWHKIPGKRFNPRIGEWKQFRDPSVLKTPDGKFHLVWTTGESGFGYASSPDGMNWEKEKFIKVEDKEGGYEFVNVWAPELYYENDTTYIIWSSTLKKDYVPPAVSSQWWTATYDHRLYYTSTKDFETFTATKAFWNPGFNTIDAAVHKTDSLYYLFFKDEQNSGKNVLLAEAKQLFGPYRNIKPISSHLTEGAIPVKTDTAFVLYYDYYHENNGYRYITSKNLQDWSKESLPQKKEFTDTLRHGSIIKIKNKELQKILKRT